MNSVKKQLILRLASWSGFVLALALFVGGVALMAQQAERRNWEDAQKAARAQAVDRSRKYLGELAKRIVKLPVDPTLVGEIESRYFEDQATGPMQVWGMGTDGAFLFGVPREAFSRLNAVYDREVTPRLKEGVFFDRQAFLLGHLDEGEGPVLTEDLIGDEATGGVLARVRRAGADENVFVLSAPLKTEQGTALGSLYLRREVREREPYQTDQRFDNAAGVAGGIAALSFVFLWVLLPTWVYVDARERGVRRAPLFAFLVVLSSLVGLVVYLIARPEDGRTLSCPGCGREVNGGAFCPHCGRDLSASFCSACRYPLKPDWVFCPACRAEIKPGAPEAPPAG